ncbi:hypothetical protein J6590_049418 [Homalodisca vitripennis]|nr:hypothetical protein J6590_049418 [Homalodisca vitripennis]
MVPLQHSDILSGGKSLTCDVKVAAAGTIYGRVPLLSWQQEGEREREGECAYLSHSLNSSVK